MIEIKAFYGDWKEATEAQTISFYNTFCNGSAAIPEHRKQSEFNKNHIRGAKIINEKIEFPEQTKERVFNGYKDRLKSNEASIKNSTRFNVVEYLCHFPEINPYEMAASLVKDGFAILYDDSSISIEENNIKRRKVEKLLKVQEV